MPKMTKYALFYLLKPFYQLSRPRKHFMIMDSERRVFGLKIMRKKKHGVDNVEKSLRSFKINSLKKLIFGYPKSRRFETCTKCQISLKISFIVSKIYFRGLKAFRLILGTKFLIRPIDQLFFYIF